MGEDPQFDSAAVLARLAKLTSALEELTRTLAKSSETPEESDEKTSAKEINSRFCDDQKMRTDFIRSDLRKLRKSPEIIADKRYKGKWGPYWKDDPLKSSWRVREANRYIAEIYRRRELRPVQYSIVIGLVAVAIAVLAIPVGDSIFAQLRHLLGI